MCEFDYNDTEAAHLADIHSGFESHNMSFEEEIAEAEYQKVRTIVTLSGLDEDYYARQKERRKRRKQEKHNLFVIVQDSRKGDTTLMLVDRRKSKKYWWTHDFSIAYIGTKNEIDKAAKKFKYNNVRVISYKEYLEQRK